MEVFRGVFSWQAEPHTPFVDIVIFKHVVVRIEFWFIPATPLGYWRE